MHAALTPPEYEALFNGPWLAGLEVDARAALIRNGRVARMPAGTRRTGRRFELRGSLCGVAQGAAKLSARLASGRELAISFAPPGSWLGSAFGDAGGAPSLEIEARGPLTLLVVEPPELEGLMRIHPAIALALLRLNGKLSHRLGEMLEEQSDMPLSQRVGRQLALLGRRFGVAAGEEGGVTIGLKVSQQDLADLTGACRQRVNAQIKAFERQGMLRMHSGLLALRPELASM